MKKYLPLILVGAGILILIGVFVLIKSNRGSTEDEEETAPEIPFELRPATSLTPSIDTQGCTELALIAKDINIDAVSLDYELLYELPDGRTQGVPGTIMLNGQKDVERDLLLGSESSGKRRCDEGVSKGTLTFRFRNDKGKLVGKLTTDFRLQSGTKDLTTVDGKFGFTLDEDAEDVLFLVMNTFGVSEMPTGTRASEPYGIFASEVSEYPGKVEIDGAAKNLWDGSKWTKLGADESPDIGVFLGTSE